jgi:hypothetical protein
VDWTTAHRQHQRPFSLIDNKYASGLKDNYPVLPKFRSCWWSPPIPGCLIRISGPRINGSQKDKMLKYDDHKSMIHNIDQIIRLLHGFYSFKSI